MEYVGRLADEFRPERVILFGSLGEGRATADSDVDLMVVMEGKANGMDRALEIRRRIPRSFPLDLIVKTPGEIRRGVKNRDGFICSVLERGRVLYERPCRLLDRKIGRPCQDRRSVFVRPSKTTDSALGRRTLWGE